MSFNIVDFNESISDDYDFKSNNSNFLTQLKLEARRKILKDVSYSVVVPILVIFGILGNVLHLITLRSHSLRSVPFRYIRAIALFDLLGLICIGVFCVQMTSPTLSSDYPMNYYLALFLSHFLIPIMNCLLTSSLFTALVLTVERYRSASILQFHQLKAVQFTQRIKANFYIFASLCLSFVLFLPLAFENSINCLPVDDYNNCTFAESQHDFWKKYKLAYNWIREAFCRIIPVIFLAVLNAVLVRKVNQIQKRRNLMKLRQLTNLNELQMMRPSIYSFAEKRITTMMVSISFIYVIGNIPQAISMVLTGESTEEDFCYQIFRSFANITEIGNHCLNFYIFCLTSQDYLKTFVRHCHHVKKKFRLSRRNSEDSQSMFCEKRSYYINVLEDDLVCL